MGIKEQLQGRLRDQLTENELTLLPSGFQIIGKKIIIKLPSKLMEKKYLIANAYLELLPHMESVYLNEGKVKGKFREPEIIHLTGKENDIAFHKEHGVIYKFDITKIMFSQGNLRERRHLASLVKDGEIIIDMFAGIGYFSLPIGKLSNPKKIYSIELNPLSHQYLVENIKLNNLEDIIEPIHGDCKEIVLEISNEIKADRVIMGVFPAPKEFIKEALSLVKDSGTTYHYEGVVDKEEIMDLFEEFSEIAKNLGFKTYLKDKRVVKSYGPGLFHVVLDIEVSY
ncbi:MAG: class I SAM-dependent methyltransferase family protein [Promethearchaeota archaeon]|nr:MAG: class I SAM-dependent methyltransferase family protein [Candidatus Lokiarchaeota archaeon]